MELEDTSTNLLPPLNRTLVRIPTRLRRYARVMIGVNSLSIIASIVTIILLALALAYPPTVSDGSGTAGNVTVACITNLTINDTLCNETTECRQGYVTSEGRSCKYYNQPSTATGCSSACYNRTASVNHCDAAGNCIGNSTSCTGTCTIGNECDNLDLFNDNLMFTLDPTTNWIYAAWYAPVGCIFGKCAWAILDIYTGSSTVALSEDPQTYNFTVLGAQTRCLDYLAVGIPERYKGCLAYERYTLSELLVDYDLFSLEANTTLPIQTSVCIFYMTCSITFEVQPPSPIEAPSPGTKRSLTQTPARHKTREEWGFGMTRTGETPAPGLGPMGINDPDTAAAVWQHFHTLVRDAVPTYLATYLEVKGLKPVAPVTSA